MKGLVQGRPELQLLPPLSTAHGSQGQQRLLNKAAPSYPLAPAAPALLGPCLLDVRAGWGYSRYRRAGP